MGDNPEKPTGRLRPDFQLLEGYLDRLREQIHRVELDLARLQETDERQTKDVAELRTHLTAEVGDMRKELDQFKGTLDTMAADMKATRTSQAHSEAALEPIQKDIASLKSLVARAASILAILDLTLKLLLAKFVG